MTVDPSNLAPAALAGELAAIADHLTGVGLEFYAAEVREAARRIAPATAALADVPPRLELVDAAEKRAADLLAGADRSFG